MGEMRNQEKLPPAWKQITWQVAAVRIQCSISPPQFEKQSGAGAGPKESIPPSKFFLQACSVPCCCGNVCYSAGGRRRLEDGLSWRRDSGTAHGVALFAQSYAEERRLFLFFNKRKSSEEEHANENDVLRNRKSKRRTELGGGRGGDTQGNKMELEHWFTRCMFLHHLRWGW